MGRASNRKKAQRQAGQAPRQASRSFRADAGTQQAMRQLAAGLQALVQETNERKGREAAVRRTWSGGAEPVPAEARRWPEGSLGDRFFTGTYLEEARNAPSLATAAIPDAAVIAADPVHWNVATDALVRAVVFDGLGLDHPAVRELLEVLAPIAEAELAYRKAADAAMYQIGTDGDDDEPEFPEQDGPVFLLGACVLVDAVWAAVGDDPLRDVLPVGLTILSALAQLCRSESPSVLQRAA